MESVVQTAQVHKMIWKIAEEVRGSVDGWDFKIYVLGFLFYRFLSEDIKPYANSIVSDENRKNKDYAEFCDDDVFEAKDRILGAKGYFINPSDLFENVLKEASKDETKLANLNERLKEVFENMQQASLGKPSQKNFDNLFADIDLNSNKLGSSQIERNKRLLKILEQINELKLSYKDDKGMEIDLFGDAYEFLMMMYASNAGKSGGEFFTPQEVSKLLVYITLHNHSDPNNVYDPACGSGSLLLQYKKILNKDPKLGYFGQEKNITTYNLARMNMFLHNVRYDKFNIAHGDTLVNPSKVHLEDKQPFDAIVSNPPYSTSWEGKKNETLARDSRFVEAGVLAPPSNADLAFVMHILSWLSNEGCAAIVCFPGIMYRGGAEQQIRGYLVENNYVDSVISLGDNLFFGTSIAVCILVLRKNKTNDTNVFFIDASKEFIKSKNKNILTDENITNILDLYKERKDIPYACKLVSIEDIKENSYNLSVSSYVESEDKREVIDIKNLNEEIEQIVKKQYGLRKEIDLIVSEIEKEA